MRLHYIKNFIKKCNTKIVIQIIVKKKIIIRMIVIKMIVIREEILEKDESGKDTRIPERTFETRLPLLPAA